MAELTTPGPLGGGPPAPATPLQTPPPPGVKGPGSKPGPIGSVPPVALPQVPVQTQELSLVGDFPKPPSWTAKVELDLLNAGHWFPSSLDFLAVAGSGSQIVSNSGDFLLKIVKAPKQISRLNFFSHGIFGALWLQGVIDPQGLNVTESSQDFTTWTQVHSPGGKAIVDPFAKWFGDKGENSGNSITVGATTITLDAVRRKFVQGATMWLYLCHAAGDPKLFQEVANTFQVTAKGFSGEIVYCPPQPGFPANRRSKIAVSPTDACANGNVDFKTLDSAPPC